MGIVLIPDTGREVLDAVVRVLEREGIMLEDRPSAYPSRWRSAGLTEGVERTVGSSRVAPLLRHLATLDRG